MNNLEGTAAVGVREALAEGVVALMAAIATGDGEGLDYSGDESVEDLARSVRTGRPRVHPSWWVHLSGAEVGAIHIASAVEAIATRHYAESGSWPVFVTIPVTSPEVAAALAVRSGLHFTGEWYHEGPRPVTVSGDHAGTMAVMEDVMATSPLSPGSTVALVGESTPEYLEYGGFRGWVLLDRSGAYYRDVTAAEIASVDILWDDVTDGDYERTGVVQ